MIEQATIINKDKNNLSQVRYDFDTGILYHQNRSYDSILTLGEYNAMKVKTIEMAKIKNFHLEFKIVKTNTLWDKLS